MRLLNIAGRHPLICLPQAMGRAQVALNTTPSRDSLPSVEVSLDIQVTDSVLMLETTTIAYLLGLLILLPHTEF